MKRWDMWKHLETLSGYSVVNLDLNKVESRLKTLKSVSLQDELGRNVVVKGFEFGTKKTGFKVKASFKDIYGGKHNIIIEDILLSGMIVNFFRKLVGKRIGILVTAITVDDENVIGCTGDTIMPFSILYPPMEPKEN